MQEVQDLINLVSDQVGALAQSDVVLGEPIVLGDITLVPLSRISVGFGAGGGSGEAQPGGKASRHARGQGSGGGGGGGGRIRPIGVIVFSPEGVEVKVLPNKPGLLDKLFDKLPGFIEKVQALMDPPEATSKTVAAEG